MNELLTEKKLDVQHFFIWTLIFQFYRISNHSTFGLGNTNTWGQGATFGDCLFCAFLIYHSMKEGGKEEKICLGKIINYN